MQQLQKKINSDNDSHTLIVGSSLSSPQKANAYYETQFPENLEYDGVADLSKLRKDRIGLKKQEQENNKKISSASVAASTTEEEISDELFSYGSVIWGSALWLLSGSRSNPLILPIGNTLYNEDEEDWLNDRNDVLFSTLPKNYLFILFVIFIVLGCITDIIVRTVTEDSTISLQFACTSFISGGALELGRIFSGEKRVTREYYDNEMMLQDEFKQFATSRLMPGGNCHRSEVVKAFRRYNSKYRQDDTISDLEIERVFRLWSQTTMNINMSSAGFFTGMQINEDADVFA